MKPRALIFDLDETLVVEEASVKAAFLETCELASSRHGVDASALSATLREICRVFWHAAPMREWCVRVGVSSWEGLWGEFKGDDPCLDRLREWAPGYRHKSWYEALRVHGVDDTDFAGQLAERFRVIRANHHVAYDDAKPVLDKLRNSYRLGLLTNGISDVQRNKIWATGLGEYFDAIVVSGEIGYGKPDGRVFKAMVSALGVSADAALMIGDGLHSDISGAQGVGMKAIWVNRLGKPPTESAVPDIEIPDLTRLQDAIERIEVSGGDGPM